MEQIVTFKYQCMGNDYLVYDPNRNPTVLSPSGIARLCDRHFGIGADGVLVGCARYGPSLELPGIELIHFMIGEKYQGRGYGKAAVLAVAAEMFRHFDVPEIWLSVDPQNARARHVYEAAGFFATGMKDKHEDVFCLKRQE